MSQAPGLSGTPGLRPTLERGDESVLREVLGEPDVADDPREGGDQFRGLDPRDGIDHVMRVGGHHGRGLEHPVREAVFERAKAVSCLSQEDAHDAPGGGIVVRPWGERSFYAEDPWKNPICFVEEGTVHAG